MVSCTNVATRKPHYLLLSKKFVLKTKKKGSRPRRYVKFRYLKNFSTLILSSMYIIYAYVDFSLEQVIMEGGRLYLVFEYLNVDLKRYLDEHGRKNLLEPMLVKVCTLVKIFICLEFYVSDVTRIDVLSR